MASMIHAFGDSFVAADQDIRHNDYEYRDYLKYNVSFASLIAKHFNLPFKNYAEYGSGSYPQVDKLLINIKNGNIKSTDVVLFGITASTRGRFLIGTLFPSKHMVNGIVVDKDASDIDIAPRFDYYYILSILENISKTFNIRIIKFNLFNDWSTNLNLSTITDFIGLDSPGNTLIDILNDTWGEKKQENKEHWLIEIPDGYEHFYTIRKHPSPDGHRKIADWFIENVDFTSNTLE